MKAGLVLPNQLVKEAENWSVDKIFLVEAERCFIDLNFHKQKLVLHRASMKAFAEEIDQEVEYIKYTEGMEKVFKKADEIRMFDSVDHSVREKVSELSERHNVKLDKNESPLFLTSMEWNRSFFQKNDYYHKKYYQEQRKRLDVLVDEEGKPAGGKWSFDPENRKKLPEDLETPEIPKFSNSYVEEAKEYVEENFPDNPGSMEKFFWPTTREEAKENFEGFLKNRIENFGDYQDAIDQDERFAFHSLISSSLNIGLLDPEIVVERTVEEYEKRGLPLNSVEGFLRQVIGWREYIRAVYELEGEDMRESNFFNCSNSLPQAFYTAETGLEPVDNLIEAVDEYAYAHHIERLMVLGNIMLLLETDPDDVNDWFMEMFIDSYDWVMVPNVYGMSQYASEKIMTKPYISSSNYIKKMSHYSEGEWSEVWDALYWNFIHRHRDKIEGIQRMSFMTSHLDRMNEEKLESYREKAEDYRKDIGCSE